MRFSAPRWLILLVALAFSPSAAQNASQGKKKLVVGCITRYYPDFFMAETLKTAAAEVQRHLGADFNLELEYKMVSSRDFAYISTDPAAAGLRTRIATSLLDNELAGVDLVVGGESSDEVEVFSPLMTQRGLFYFSPWATNPKFSDKKAHPYFVRLMMPDQYGAHAAVSVIQHFGYNKVKVLTCTDVFCQGLADVFGQLAQEAGVSVVRTHVVDELTLDDDYQGVQAIKDFLTDCSETRVVVFAMSPETTPVIFSSATKLGVIDDIIWIGVGHVKPSSQAGVSAHIPEGYFFVSPKQTLRDENWRVFGEWKDRLAAYGFYAWHFRGYWFDAMYAAVYSFTMAHNSQIPNAWNNASAISNQLQEMRVEGINGLIDFDSNFDPQIGQFEFGTKVINSDGTFDWVELADVSIDGRITYLEGSGQDRITWLSQTVVWPGNRPQPAQKCFFRNIAIGAILPFSADKLSFALKRAAEVAVSMVNQDPLVLPGVTVELRTVDSSLIYSEYGGAAGTQQEESAVMQEMRKEIMQSYVQTLVGEHQCENSYRQAMAILGPGRGAEVELMHDSLIQFDLLAVSPTVSSIPNAQLQSYPMLARTILGDEFKGECVAEVVLRLGLQFTECLAVSSSDARNEAITIRFKIRAAKLGLAAKYLNVEDFLGEAANHLSTCDVVPVILLFVNEMDLSRVLREASQFTGANPVWISTSAGADTSLDSNAVNQAFPEGFLLMRHGVQQTSKTFLDFLSFWENHSEDKHILQEQPEASVAADSVLALVKAIHNFVDLRQGEELNSTFLKHELSLLRFEGISGPVHLGNSMDRSFGSYVILQKQGPEFSVVGTWTQDSEGSAGGLVLSNVIDKSAWRCGLSTYCPPGLFLSPKGACVPCPQASYCPKPGGNCLASECAQCPIGANCDGIEFIPPDHSMWARTDTGIYRLESCDAGHVLVRSQDRPLNDQCVVCPQGKYSVVKARYLGALWTPNAANSTDQCHPCEFGGDCRQGANLITAQPDFWKLDEASSPESESTNPRSHLLRCPKNACKGGQNNSCSPGHEGLLCARCTEGWAASGSQCKKCGDFDFYRKLGIGLGIPICLVVWYFFSWKPLLSSYFAASGEVVTEAFGCKPFSGTLRQWINSIHLSMVRDYLKVLISHYQVVSTFDTLYVVQWSQELRAIWSPGAYVRLDFLSWPGVYCLTGGLEFHDKLKVFMLVPPFIVFCLWIPTLVLLLAGKTRDPVFSDVKNLFWGSLMIFGFVIYPQMCMVTVQAVNCRHIGKDNLLLADLRKECPLVDTTSSEFVWAVIGVLLYPFGIIVALFSFLRFFGVASMASRKQRSALLQEVIRKYIGFSSRKLTAKLAAFVGGGQGLAEAEQRAKIVFEGASNKSESVTKEGLVSYLRARGIDGKHEEEIDVLVNRFDSDGNGQLEWEEFFAMITAIMEKEQLFTGHETVDSITTLQVETLYYFPWVDVLEAPQAHQHAASKRVARASAASYSARKLTEATFTRRQPTAVSSGSDSQYSHRAARKALMIRNGWSVGLGFPRPFDDAGSEQLAWVLHAGEIMVSRGVISPPLVTWNGDCAGETDLVSQLGFTFRTYKVNFWYFETLELVRKAWMTSIIALIAPNSAEQIAAALVVTLLYIGVYLRAAPFANPAIDKLMGLSLTAQAATLGWGLMLEFWRSTGTLEQDSDTRARDLVLEVLAFGLHLSVLVMPLIYTAYRMRMKLRQENESNGHQSPLEAAARPFPRGPQGEFVDLTVQSSLGNQRKTRLSPTSLHSSSAKALQALDPSASTAGLMPVPSDLHGTDSIPAEDEFNCPQLQILQPNAQVTLPIQPLALSAAGPLQNFDLVSSGGRDVADSNAGHSGNPAAPLSPNSLRV